MKQNNLWIAALALGITLSAHGQQSGGGITHDVAANQTVLSRNADR